MSLAALITTARSNIRYSCVVRIVRFGSSQSGPEAQTADKAEGPQYEENIRNKILEASLPFVKELGWSKEALSAGAETVGYPGVTHGMFAAGGADLVTYFNKSSNQMLVEFMREHKENPANKELPPVQFVENACRHRLEMIVPYLGRWPQAIAIMSLPPNMPNALATLLTMVDDICYNVGDRSVDFNWYTRRVALAGVYKASELYLVQDRSPEHEETWKFLNRRLTEAAQLHDVIHNSEKMGQNAKEAVAAVFTTARNILGLSKAT